VIEKDCIVPKISRRMIEPDGTLASVTTPGVLGVAKVARSGDAKSRKGACTRCQ
jgi:hypothetical protein